MRRWLLVFACGCGGMDFHAEVAWQDDVPKVRHRGKVVASPFEIDEHFATPADARAWHDELVVGETVLWIASTCANDSATEHASVEEDLFWIRVHPMLGPILGGRGRCDDSHWDE